MRRIYVSVVCAILLSTVSYPVQAATKSDLLLKGFQSYVSIAKSALVIAKVKYDSEVAAINTIYANSAQIAKSSYEKEILAAKNLYEPQINNSNQAIKDAQARLLTVTQVKVLKQGTDRNSWGFLNCSTTRPNCIYVDKGALFLIGEITTLKTFAGEPLEFEYLRDIQTMIDDGLIELLNAVEYQKAVNTIKTDTEKKKNVTAQWNSANLIATNKQTSAVDSARITAGTPLVTLMQNYESDKLVIGNQITAGNTAITAVKRASKNPSVFDKAFLTALKFEHNRVRLDDLASQPWTNITNLKSLNSAVAVTKMSEEADLVGDKYSYNAASRINSGCGNVFISEQEFTQQFSLIASFYKKVTKIMLKL